MKSNHLTVLVLLALFLPLPAQPAGLTPLQVMHLRSVQEVAVSPDGSLVAFSRVVARGAEDRPGATVRHLYLMPAEGSPGDERLVVGGSRTPHGLAFSPDGRLLTFVDEREEVTHPEVYGLPLDGGEPRPVTRTAGGVLGYRWRPDGQALAFTSPDPPPPVREAARKLGFDQVVVDEDWSHVSLWVWDVAAEQARRLTLGATVFSFEWVPDGERLAAGVAPNPLVDSRYVFTRLHTVDAATGQMELLVDNPGKLGAYAWSPAGRRLAYVSAVDRRDPHAGVLHVREADGSTRALTRDMDAMVHGVEWISEEEILCGISLGVVSTFGTVRVSEGQGVNVGLQASGGTGGPLAWQEFVHSPATGKRYLAASSPAHPAELFRVERGVFTRMTDSNPWLAQVALGRQTVEKFTARDGLEIEGLLMHPLSEEADKPAPLVIVAHGGPESHYSNEWLTSYSNWGQVLAARGYRVWFPNYRSSTGYGVEFARKDHGDPMGAEFEDHLDAIAHFARMGLIDPARVGIGGGSYGGYTAAWAATRHSEHFAAAVSFVPFVDIRTKWYTSDIPNEFHRVHYEEKWPHEQVTFLAERSPLTYADQCRTPLLLLGGTRDPRVHPSQPFMLYRAVKTSTQTPVRYVQYPGEGHGNRSNVHQYDYLLRTLRWFEHYLRPGDHRRDPPPPLDLDYGGWGEPSGR